MASLHPGLTCEVAVDALDRDGRGVGDGPDRSRIAVAGLLPGERGQVRIDHASPHRKMAWATLLQRYGPAAPERVAPPCPAFGSCGGCVWQHLAYPAQLEEKRERVKRALAEIEDLGAEIGEVVAAPAEVGYRGFGKYVIGSGAAGEIVLGSYAPRSHHLVSTIGCRVVEPIIDQIAVTARGLLGESGMTVYDETRREGELRYLLVRANHRGRALVGIVTASSAKERPLRRLARALRAAHPVVVGVVWVKNDSTSATLLGPEERSLTGADTLVDRLGDTLEVQLSIGAFFQINRAQAIRLYRSVADWVGAGPDTSAVDLYCGVGGIGLTLALRGAAVLGVERHGGAIAAATWAARRLGLGDRARFVEAAAEELPDLAEEPGVIVVNPPRKGLTSGARAAVVAVAPRRIAYVSCAPESLARDLAGLRTAGYRADRIAPFDLMPGTSQVETAVLLRRVG